MRDLAAASAPVRFAVPVLLTGVGFALRFGELPRYWISADEGLRHFIARAPLAESLELLLSNAHPPLFALLLRLLAPFGDGILWLRTPSLVCGTLAIPVVYAAGRRIAGPLAGGIAAALLALSPAAIAMSQVARPYGLQLLLVSFLLASALRAIDSRRKRDLWIYSAFAAAAVLTQYGSCIAVASTLALFGVERIRSRAPAFSTGEILRAHLPVLAVLACVFAIHIGPRLWNSSLRSDAVESWLAPYFDASAGQLWRNALGVFTYLAGSRLGGTLALAFAGAMLLLGARGGRLARPALLCAAAFVCAILLSVASLYPFGGTRHATLLAPFVFIAVGVAAASIAERGAAAIGSWIALLGLFALFGASAERSLGMSARASAAYPELQITAEEGAWATSRLEALSTGPGLVITDRSTAFTLAPSFADALATARPIGDLGVDRFAWGKREVRMIGRWLLRVRPNAEPRDAHLATALAAAPIAAGTDVQVFVSQPGSVAAGFAAVARGGPSQRAGVLAVEADRHFQLFTLDVDRYRAALRAAEAGDPR